MKGLILILMTCMSCFLPGFSVDQPQAVPVSAPQTSGFSDGIYQVSESLQTLSEFNAEDILSIKQEDAGSSSDYYSLESSPNAAQPFLENTPTPDCYSNPIMYEPPMPYFGNGHSTFKGQYIKNACQYWMQVLNTYIASRSHWCIALCLSDINFDCQYFQF